MNQLEERLAALTPEQRALVLEKLRAQHPRGKPAERCVSAQWRCHSQSAPWATLAPLLRPAAALATGSDGAVSCL